MTTLTITPNYAHKTARFAGIIAAGEKVLTEIVGAGAWVAPGGTQTLRLRVIFGNKLITKFPFYTAADVSAGTVQSADAWDTSGTNPKCVLNLNTIPAAKMKGGGMCLWILDDPTNDILYAADTKEILPWHREEGADEPYDLDEYPDIIAEFRDRISAAEAAIANEIDVANGIVAQVTAAKTAAEAAQSGATTQANNAAVSAILAEDAQEAAEGAQEAAEAAQTAAETAQGKAEDAQEAAEAAQVAAEAAQAAAEAALPIDDTLSAEGKAADAKAVGDALADKQNKLSSDQLAAANSGITAALVKKLGDMDADGEANVQPDWDETDPSKDAFIKNKPTLATIATTGKYSDLIGVPDQLGYVRISGGKVQAVIPG